MASAENPKRKKRVDSKDSVIFKSNIGDGSGDTKLEDSVAFNAK